MADVFGISFDYFFTTRNDHYNDNRMSGWSALFGDCSNYEQRML